MLFLFEVVRYMRPYVFSITETPILSQEATVHRKAVVGLTGCASTGKWAVIPCL